MSRLRLLATAIACVAPGVAACVAACAPASPGAPPPAAPRLAAPRLAAQIAKNAEALFVVYDRDHDHRLDPGEAVRLALAGEAFAALDLDADGALSRAEFLAPARIAGLEAAFRGFTARWVAVSDQDGDGRLSRAEYDQATLGPEPGLGALPHLDPAGAAFAAADADADGLLAPDEALALVGWLLENGWRLAPRGGVGR